MASLVIVSDCACNKLSKYLAINIKLNCLFEVVKNYVN